MQEEEEAEFAEQMRREQASELGAQLQGVMFTQGETTNEVQLFLCLTQPNADVYFRDPVVCTVTRVQGSLNNVLATRYFIEFDCPSLGGLSTSMKVYR